MSYTGFDAFIKERIKDPITDSVPNSDFKCFFEYVNYIISKIVFNVTISRHFLNLNKIKCNYNIIYIFKKAFKIRLLIFGTPSVIRSYRLCIS